MKPIVDGLALIRNAEQQTVVSGGRLLHFGLCRSIRRLITLGSSLRHDRDAGWCVISCQSDL